MQPPRKPRHHRTMRLRRYTRLAGDKGAHKGRLHIFCFAMRVGLAPAALHIVGYHNSDLSEDCPTNRVPLLVGLTTMASSSTTASGPMVGYGK